MGTLALLTAVATLLIGHHVPVTSAPPPWAGRWVGNTAGWAKSPPDQIGVRHPVWAVQLRHPWLEVFGHEIIHLQHKSWSEKRIYGIAHWYSQIVARTIRRLRH